MLTLSCMYVYSATVTNGKDASILLPYQGIYFCGRFLVSYLFRVESFVSHDIEAQRKKIMEQR